jgi:CheY-like chemotaxis protein
MQKLMRPADILVVEDDEDMAETMIRLLALKGFPARWARNGKVAVEAVAHCQPALVLLDILMPVMDGWECARRLRASYGKDIPIIVITAAEHVESRCAAIGANHLLPKPFELKELLRLVSLYVVPQPRSPELSRKPPDPRLA